jgi:hypothetical protein
MMERRASERKAFDQPLELEMTAVEAGRAGNLTCRGAGVDICPDGLGLLSGYPLARGMVIRLAIQVGNTGNKLPVFAEVAWVSPAEERFRAGVRFLR